MRLGSRVAVALAEAGGYSSDSTPRLGTSICCGSGPRNSNNNNDKKTKDKKKENSDINWVTSFSLTVWRVCTLLKGSCFVSLILGCQATQLQ